jgi:hypothetical protein
MSARAGRRDVRETSMGYLTSALYTLSLIGLPAISDGRLR